MTFTAATIGSWSDRKSSLNCEFQKNKFAPKPYYLLRFECVFCQRQEIKSSETFRFTVQSRSEGFEDGFVEKTGRLSAFPNVLGDDFLQLWPQPDRTLIHGL